MTFSRWDCDRPQLHVDKSRLLVLQPHLEISDPALVMEPAGAGLVAAAPA
jgi:hypothetical protein